MKIKNDLISIKIGKKKYNFNNLILDSYIKEFVKSQLDKEYGNATDKSLDYLFIKFDNVIPNIAENSDLKAVDFDIALTNGTSTKNQFINSEFNISIEYIYKTAKTDMVYDFINNESKTFGEFFNNRKITAIGFGKSYASTASIEAILDTSNYNLYLTENEDFYLLRRDIIITDALFYTNNIEKVKAPLHLLPIKNEAIIKPTELIREDGGALMVGSNESFGILTSVGLSLNIDIINKEFVLGEDVEAIVNDTDIEIKDIKNYLFKSSLYPNQNVFCGTFLQPIEANYKYLILKYTVYQEILSGTYENPTWTITDTGSYYYQILPLFLNGNLNLKIKYERS